MQRQRLTGYPTSLGELVRLEVDVIVVGGGASAIRSAKDATNTIPIVMTGTADPVASGLIVSLARPGGNVTGPTFGGYELAGKRLELLKEIVPKVSPVAVLLSATSPTVALSLNEMQNSARALGLQIQALEVQSASDFERAFQAAIKARVRILSVDPSRYLALTENTSCSLRQKPIARNLSLEGVRGRWRSDVLRSEVVGFVSSCGDLCRQDPKRCQAGRFACRAADEVRVCYQLKDRPTNWTDDSAVDADAG